MNLDSAYDKYVVSCAIAVQADIPFVAWGPPGVGKTAIMGAVAKALGRHHEVVIASIHEESDLGFPRPNYERGCVEFMLPDFVMECILKRPSIMTLDEFSTARPSMQAACLRLIHERRVGTHSLDGVYVCALANPAETTQGAYCLTAPMANRFCHLFKHADVVDTFERALLG